MPNIQRSNPKSDGRLDGYRGLGRGATDLR